jgi:hypothetical protein
MPHVVVTYIYEGTRETFRRNCSFHLKSSPPSKTGFEPNLTKCINETAHSNVWSWKYQTAG